MLSLDILINLRSDGLIFFFSVGEFYQVRVGVRIKPLHLANKLVNLCDEVSLRLTWLLSQLSIGLCCEDGLRKCIQIAKLLLVISHFRTYENKWRWIVGAAECQSVSDKYSGKGKRLQTKGTAARKSDILATYGPGQGSRIVFNLAICVELR